MIILPTEAVSDSLAVLIASDQRKGKGRMAELSASSGHITEIQILSFPPLKEKAFAGLDFRLLSLFAQSDS